MRYINYKLFLLVATLTVMSVITFLPTPLSSPTVIRYRDHFQNYVRYDNVSTSDKSKNITHEDNIIMYRNVRPRTFYPKRTNMGECPPLFGKVLIFVAYVEESMKTHYKVAQESLQCYLKGTNYSIAMVDVKKDPKILAECGHHSHIFFQKHCAASVYLKETDWLFVLDADTGVANPNHCIEEWIDDRVDIMFYERIFNYEIASGNYIIRNSEFSYNFLKKWSDYEFHQPSNWNGADNGVLQILILQTAIPDAVQEYENCVKIWHEGKDYNTYMNYVTCVKLSLGANRLWPGKVRIYRRAHGWVRDGFLTTDKFCDADFMLHGWKKQTVGLEGWESSFKENLKPELCGKGESGWNWRDGKRTSCEVIKREISNFEKSASKNYPKEAREIPHLRLPDVGLCYPNCDKYT